MQSYYKLSQKFLLIFKNSPFKKKKIKTAKNLRMEASGFHV